MSGQLGLFDPPEPTDPAATRAARTPVRGAVRASQAAARGLSPAAAAGLLAQVKARQLGIVAEVGDLNRSVLAAEALAGQLLTGQVVSLGEELAVGRVRTCRVLAAVTAGVVWLIAQRYAEPAPYRDRLTTPTPSGGFREVLPLRLTPLGASTLTRWSALTPMSSPAGGDPSTEKVRRPR